LNVLVTLALLATAFTYPRPSSDIATYSQSVATVTDSSYKGDDGFILATRGSFVSIQWLKHTNGHFRRKYMVAGGKRMFPNFYWGISYAWFNGSDYYSNKKVWKAGFQYDFNRNISFGLVIDDLNRPKFGDIQTERFYTLGAAITSNQRRITFSIDTYLEEKSGLDNTEVMFRLEFKPSKTINIAGDYRTEGFFRIGLVYSWRQFLLQSGTNARAKVVCQKLFFYNRL